LLKEDYRIGKTRSLPEIFFSRYLRIDQK